MEKLPCEIVQDLLPSYADGLTSEKTNVAVSDHLETCEGCRETYRRMKEPEKSSPQEEKEIDFLKKARKKRIKTAIISVVSVLALVFVLYFAKVFWIGYPVSGEAVSCNLEVSGKELNFQGFSLNSARYISRISCKEENGVLTLTARSVLAAPWCDAAPSYTYTAKENIRQVRLGDRILWDCGFEIPATVSALYNSAHDYVGSPADNNQTAQCLYALADLGPFTSRLDTETTPYGWTICLENPVDPNREDSLRETMTASASVYLGLIGNLDVVTYEYQVDGEIRSLTVTAEEATAAWGQDIKSAASAPSILRALLAHLGLLPQGAASFTASEDTVIWLFNCTDTPVYGFGLNYYDGNTLLCGVNQMNANGSPLEPGEALSFCAEDDLTLLDNVQQFRIEISLLGENGQNIPVSSSEPLLLRSGFTYVFALSQDQGYTVSPMGS